MHVRTRMAPSPTGEYHIGSMRTFLYNYAFAKKNGGEMVLRIEDTDKTREVAGALDRIIDVIHDYGLSWDEGPDVGGPYGPYIQSDRIDLYKEYASELVRSGHAYYCFCSSERLDALREEQKAKGQVTRYDKHCLNLSEEEVKQHLDAGDSYVIRLKVPDNEELSWDDLITGKVTINSSDIDHQVLLKSDGFPTYHLAVVVDDHLMKVSHIMRGNEWLPSTPKQILLYKYLDWDMPAFGHLPNLKEVGANKKLSKRFGDVHAIKFLEKGYLPEALINFLMLLGWNPGTEQEIYSLEEFINDFSLEKVHKTDLVSFDREKLLWMNGHYIRSLSLEDLQTKIQDWSVKFGVVLCSQNFEEEYALKVLSLVQERMKLLSEYNLLTSFFFKKPEIDISLLKSFARENSIEVLKTYLELYNSVETKDWNPEYLEKVSRDLLHKTSYKPKEAFMTIRIAVSGEKATPPLFDMLSVLGKDECVARFKTALELLQ